jgi:hypothetical protein
LSVKKWNGAFGLRRYVAALKARTRPRTPNFRPLFLDKFFGRAQCQNRETGQAAPQALELTIICRTTLSIL